MQYIGNIAKNDPINE